MLKDKVAVIYLDRHANTCIYDRNKALVRRERKPEHDEELEKDLLAFIIVMNDLYDKHPFK
jgi:hypothetical protein